MLFRSQPPNFQDVLDAAGNEIQVEAEETFSVPSFSESNRVMKKDLDKKKPSQGKRREKMIQENPTSTLENTVQDLAKMVEILSSKLEKQTSPRTYAPPPKENNYERDAPRPTGKLWRHQLCYYCL